MVNKTQQQLFNEHIEKLKHKMNYGINEAPIYKAITEDEFGNDDALPDQFTQEEPMPNNQEPQPQPDANEAPASGTTAPPAGPVPDITKQPEAGAAPMDNPMGQPEESTDKIQNDIIRQNINTMKLIHDKLENLEGLVQNLNQEYSRLNAEVEEVREPSNGEKLMSKKDVSAPFYNNLNDVWKGNWFEKSREQENEKGIRELPDGSFVADFDEMPEFSKTDIQQSFSKTM